MWRKKAQFLGLACQYMQVTDSVTTRWRRVSLLFYCAEISQRQGLRNPLLPLITELFPFFLLIILISHPLINYPNIKKKKERTFRKVCAIPFQIFLVRLSGWVNTSSTREHRTENSPWEAWDGLVGWRSLSLGEIMLKSVLLLFRNIQERTRIKHSYRLTGLCSAEFEFFNRAGRITKTWPEGALWVLPLPGKGHLMPFKEIIIYGTFLSYPQPLLIDVKSLENFPDFEDDFNFHFLLKLGMWCICWAWLKSMSSLFCAVAKYNWSWWHQSPGRQLKAGKW